MFVSAELVNRVKQLLAEMRSTDVRITEEQVFATLCIRKVPLLDRCKFAEDQGDYSANYSSAWSS